MTSNSHHLTGFASCSDRALAEKATAFYYALSNNTELANALPEFENFYCGTPGMHGGLGKS